MAGYHLADIPKGELGQLSKIQEELSEAVDAEAQDCRIMVLLELADMLGAVDAYLAKHFSDMSLKDLHKMATITRRAFESGDRK